MSEWSETTIGAVGMVYDGPHATPKTVDVGPIFLGIGSLENGRVTLSDTRHVTEEDFKVWTRRVKPQKDDIVFSYETRIGQAAIIPDNFECCLGRRMGLIRVDTSRVNPRFFLYNYISPQYQDYLKSKTIYGATVDRLAIKEFPKFTITLPPLPEQKAIASTLGALDDKIELNHRMNATLEAMARTLFKSWFVDFDPTRAKSQGRTPEGMDAQTAALFPSAFSPNGLPKGWKGGTLSQIAESAGTTVQPSQTSPDTPYIGLEHMPRRNIALTEWASAGKVMSNKFAFSRGDFLFGKLRPYFHKVGIAAIDGISSTDILIVRPRQEAFYSFVLAVISSDEFVSHTDQTSRGTKMPRTNWKDIAAYSVMLPDDRIATAYNAAVGENYRQHPPKPNTDRTPRHPSPQTYLRRTPYFQCEAGCKRKPEGRSFSVPKEKESQQQFKRTIQRSYPCRGDRP